MEADEYKITTKPFDEYTHRMAIKVFFDNGSVNTSVYTTNPSKDQVLDFVEKRISKSERYIAFNVLAWCTKKQDQMLDELIDLI